MGDKIIVTWHTAHGPGVGQSWRHKKTRAARRVSRCSSSMMHDVVKEDTILRTAKMSCLFLTAAGGSEVDCWVRRVGIFFKEAHVWHVWEHWSRALSRSRA